MFLLFKSTEKLKLWQNKYIKKMLIDYLITHLWA